MPSSKSQLHKWHSGHSEDEEDKSEFKGVVWDNILTKMSI